MNSKWPIKLRKSVKLKNRTIIIKLSSMAITFDHGGMNSKQIKEICTDIAKLIAFNKVKIIIVSSGAINAGRSSLTSSNNNSSKDISFLQACSAVGQPILMHSFINEFKKHDKEVAQVLLTHEDIKNKKRSYNIRQSISTLLANDIIPIINENDCVSFDEISVGDNDQLSAMICEMMSAELLIMLTNPDGVYNRDPNDPSAKHFSEISYSNGLQNLSTISKSEIGRGGMKTKLLAVRKLTPLGISVIIGSYKFKNPISRLLNQSHEIHGTFFEGDPRQMINKNMAWILTRVRNHAIVKIDQGAKDALIRNASLLPIGIISTSGKFSRGDSVVIKFRNQIIAYGITEYNSKEIEKIKQLQVNQLGTELSYVHSKVVIHKNNLILK